MFKPFKSGLFATLLATLALYQIPVSSAAEAGAHYHLGITQIVEHPSLDAIRQGIYDELAERGYTQTNITWHYENAQGNSATAAQIARQFAGAQLDAVIGISTPSAQTLAAAVRETPIIFAAVTDPVGAKLVSALNQPGPWITGTTDRLALDQHLDLVLNLIAETTPKRVGVIYNPGEANSVASVKELETAAQAAQVELVEAAATKSSEVLMAARSLVGRVDAIYLPIDNTVISALEAVIKVAEQADLPLVTGDTDSVKRGALAAVGFNYYQVGRQTGVMVSRILAGRSPQELPVETVDKLELHLNLDAAEKMQVNLPDALIQQAQQIYAQPK